MAGAGYKLFNTGDVLTAAQVNTYLMEQTVMVFANAAARTTALSGVVSEGMISYLKDTNAVEVYDGSNWVSSDDPNAIQNTIVDAKGDLIAATAADTPARLAVGNNGETLVADSSTSTGLRWQQPKSQNPIINSSMNVWQRGTSQTLTSNVSGRFAADRWQIRTDGATAQTYSRQPTGDTTNLPNIQYCLRAQRDSGQTAARYLIVEYNFETVDSIPFVGQTVTFSFYARRGANFSGASNQITANLVSGTGTDENVGSAYTGRVDVVSQTPTLTTTWQRFTYTATVGTTANELAIQFYYVSSGTAGAADYFEITGIQVEVGSVATPYRRYSSTLAGELAACQRYYYRLTAGAGYTRWGSGPATSTTVAYPLIPFPVKMRVVPTAIDYSSGLALYDGNITAITALTNSDASVDGSVVKADVASGLTANRFYHILSNNSTSSYIGWTAEL